MNVAIHIYFHSICKAITLKVIGVFVITISISETQSQNIFPNPHFNQFSFCPTDYGQVTLLQDWNTSKSSPDFFHCHFIGTGLFNGYSPSTSGVIGMVGGPSHPGCPQSGFVEWISAKLVEPLQRGALYTLDVNAMIDDTGILSSAPNSCMDFGFYFFNLASASKFYTHFYML